MKKLFTITLVLISFTLVSQTPNYSGLWLLKDRQSLNGIDYANGLPLQIEVRQNGSKLVFNISGLNSQGKDTFYFEHAYLSGGISESITSTNRKKSISVSYSKGSNVMTRLIDLSEKVNHELPDIRMIETWVLTTTEGQDLLSLEKSVTSKLNGLLWSMKGTYEKAHGYKNGSAKANGINFQDSLSWNEVLKKAKKENKYIFMDCYATWCGPCKKMDSEVYVTNVIGEIVNKYFIPVKVQMDSSINDNERIRSWYYDARNIKNRFGINTFPTYLFFDADGRLVHREIGYKKIDNFIALLNNAVDTSKQYYTQIDKYKSGQRDYVGMIELATNLKRISDKELAKKIASNVKVEYLDKLDETKLFNKGYILFITEFPQLVNSNDNFFKLFYTQALKMDSIMGYKGSEWFVKSVIRREVIIPYLYKDTQKAKSPIVQNPNWRDLWQMVASKFDEDYADKIITSEKGIFFVQTQNGGSYVNLIDSLIKVYPPKEHNSDFSRMIGGRTGEMPDHMTLNSVAWTAYLAFNDKYSLENALEWSEMSLVFQPNNFQYLDTKARLLYKIGRINEAVVIMQKLVKDVPQVEEFRQVLQKMKNRSDLN